MKNKEDPLWDGAYRKQLIEALRPFGAILLVGFHVDTANAIWAFRPSRLTIVEHEHDPLMGARAWAKEHEGVQVVGEHWQTALPQLGIFDAIFYDGGPGRHQVFHQKESPDFIQMGKALVEQILREVPGLHTMRYTESDLDAFCKCAALTSKGHLSRFLCELEEAGQITTELRDKMARKYKLRGVRPKKVSAVFKTYIDLTFFFLKECLRDHMRKGSRFGCFSGESISKSDDHLFLEYIIANPSVDFREKLISIKAPGMKKGKKGLVVVVEKLA